MASKKKPKSLYAKDIGKRMLRYLYVIRRMTQAQIAKLLECSNTPVQKAMYAYGIPRRHAGCRLFGSSNPQWKGDEAKYKALHLRVSSARGRPKQCERCGARDPRKTYDWANLTGNYANLQDYIRLCRSCHWKIDGKARKSVV